MSPDSVVARVMSFDRDNDGRVTRDELPDRMHNLLSDATGGAIDSAAIRARAMTAPVAATATGRGFQGSGGGYTFGDQISLSTRPHVEGALDDLRLTALAREQAQAIVTPFMDKLEADSTAQLVADLHFVLTVSQLTTLRMQIDRQLSSRPGSAPNRVVRSADGKTFQVFMRGGPDLTALINGFALPPDQTKQALAAFASFKERIRPGDAERSELVSQLKDVLNDEERDNFGAALARRPLVKSGLSAHDGGCGVGRGRRLREARRCGRCDQQRVVHHAEDAGPGAGTVRAVGWDRGSGIGDRGSKALDPGSRIPDPGSHSDP